MLESRAFEMRSLQRGRLIRRIRWKLVPRRTNDRESVYGRFFHARQVPDDPPCPPLPRGGANAPGGHAASRTWHILSNRNSPTRRLFLTPPLGKGGQGGSDDDLPTSNEPRCWSRGCLR